MVRLSERVCDVWVHVSGYWTEKPLRALYSVNPEAWEGGTERATGTETKDAMAERRDLRPEEEGRLKGAVS